MSSFGWRVARALVLSSFAGTAVHAASDVPAVVTNPTPESRAELARAVSAALGGAKVTLAEDALTRESTLVVERTRRRDPNGLLANGRDLGKPDRFRLVKNGPGCVLVHENSGRRFALVQTPCAAH
ncbi:MAG TPA: hypothetical protein VE620_02055 [Myxococcales bacterium]|jgi:hypothetical protein|nr:hypothetical protein [Myxococcales bacterium]